MNNENEGGVSRLAVIGLGYIGLPTAAMFADSGLDVLGIDISQRVVDSVNSGTAHIEEGDLNALVARCVASGQLRASTHAAPADAFIIAVPTPIDHDSKQPDLSYVMAAGRSIAPVLKPGNLIVLESTSPVGTTRQLSELLADLRPDLTFPHQHGETSDIRMAYCPERIIPGRMLRELVDNDRVIGGMSAACTRTASGLYGRFVRGQCLTANDRIAELVKLTENAYRDVNIAFANELSLICDDIGIDTWRVIELANRHPRVNILNPGPGVGGHCIAVDPWFIVAGTPERARLIRTAREVNDAKPEHVIAQAETALADRPGARLACLGLSYKPDVDDFRESPALAIAQRLSERHRNHVVCTDPHIGQLRITGADAGLTVVDIGQALECEILLILVAHGSYRDIATDRHVVLDPAGCYRKTNAS